VSLQALAVVAVGVLLVALALSSPASGARVRATAGSLPTPNDPGNMVRIRR